MHQVSRLLLASLALAGGLSACGHKEQTAEQASPPATAAAAAPAAETPAADAPAAAPDTANVKAATFDLSTVPVTSAELGTFPYLGPLTGYSVNKNNSEEFDFERAYVYDGKTLLPIEGKVSQRYFDLDDNAKKASALMIRRNYENLLKGLGAVKVHSGAVAQAAIEKVGADAAYKHGKWVVDNYRETDTYVIRQANKEVWAQVSALGSDGDYCITVTERAAMPQQATIMKADELKKKLDTDGRAALYLNFDTDQAHLKADSEPAVAEIVKLLQADPALRLSVEGHTDNTSTPAHNQQLSEARARAVATALAAQGIAASRLTVAGFGQTRPLASNATEAGRAQNRRVELVKK
jgi:outer membrane protein OmpA-like peptidoglycan-associated protein